MTFYRRAPARFYSFRILRILCPWSGTEVGFLLCYEAVKSNNRKITKTGCI